MALNNIKAMVRKVFRFYHQARIYPSKADYIHFVKRIGRSCIILLVYVNDIIMVGDNENMVYQLKMKLDNEFKIIDLGNLKYFLRIEVAKSKRGIHMPNEVCTRFIEGCRTSTPPLDQNTKLSKDGGEPISVQQ